MIINLLRKIYYFNSIRKFKCIGKNVILSKGGVFIHPEEISLGSNIFIARNFHISAKNLSIGNNVMIGPNLVIECTNHKYNKIGVSMFEYQNEKEVGFVVIENDVWIGANVTILPNVIIREGCIIGAGSVVTKEMPPYSICVGNPCVPIKKRFSDIELKEHLQKINSNYKFETILLMFEKYRKNKNETTNTAT